MSKNTAYISGAMSVIVLLALIFTANEVYFGEHTTEPTQQVETVEAGIEQMVKTVKINPSTFLSSTTVKEVELPQYYISEEDIELIALVTMAEAEGECEEGKRLVIDTILNRVDTNYLGAESVNEVVYQSGQFSSMWNGRVDKCYVRDDICDLVREEAQSRTNYDVIYFTAGKYGKYGTPMFSVGNHYFCSYD